MNRIFIVWLLLLTGLNTIAEESAPIKFYIEDFAFLEGMWEGELEYLDFQDGKTRVKVPVNVIVKKKTSTEDYTQYMQLKTTFTTPNGRLVSNENDMKIMEDGKGIVLDGDWKAIQKEVKKDEGYLAFSFLGENKDNNIPSKMKQSMILSKGSLTVKVEVKHESTDVWFVRSQYTISKKQT